MKFKRSLAVLTTAAIMASSMSIVAFAANEKVSFTKAASGEDGIQGVYKVVESKLNAINSGDGLGVSVKDCYIYVTTDWTVTASDGTDAVTVTKVTTGIPEAEAGVTLPTGCDVYKLTGVDNKTVAITAAAPEEEEEPAPEEEDSDIVVWSNGKDIKAKGDTKAVYYATASFDVVSNYSGGKWQVAVTDGTVDTVDKFIEAIEAGKGKLKKEIANKGKALATAKLKDGSISIKAGKSKEGGKAYVWVYETKKITDANIKSAENATGYMVAGAVKKTGVVNGEVAGKEITPIGTAITVKVADPKPMITDDKGSELKKKELKSGETLTIKVATKDTSKATVSADATYTVTLKDGKTDGIVNNGDGTWTITGTGAKMNIVAKCAESGKSAKLSITAPKNASTTEEQTPAEEEESTEATITVTAADATKTNDSTIKVQYKAKKSDGTFEDAADLPANGKIAKGDKVVITFNNTKTTCSYKIGDATTDTDVEDSGEVEVTGSMAIEFAVKS